MAGRLNLSAVRSGAAAFSRVTPPLPPVPPIGTLPGRLGVVQGPGTITFTLNGAPRWVIDVNRFAGTPTLSVKTELLDTRIALTGARFPGTLLPADVLCVVGKTTATGTPATFTFTFGGFHSQVILEDWLAGLEAMRSQVTLSGDVCPLGAVSKLSLSGTGTARFLPNWLMEIGGVGIADLSGLGPDMKSSRFGLRLLFPSDPSISSHPKSKRTLLTLPAPATPWSLQLAVTSLPIGALDAPAGLFTSAEIEAGEGPAGDTARELLATSPGAGGLSLAVAGGMTDQDGKPFVLNLASPTYAIAFDTSADHSQGDETVLTSRFGLVQPFLIVDGFVMLVGDPAGSPGFEVIAQNGAVTSVLCAPQLIGASAPMTAGPGENLAVEPGEIIGALLNFVTAPGAAPGWGVIAGLEVLGQRRLSLPDFNVAVLRREDLLALDFSFFNLALEAGGGNPPQLVVKDQTKPAYLVAQFDSPQNIAEQAYLEFTPDTTPPHPPPPPTTDPQSLPEETPGSTPDLPLIAPACSAGPSRLAFRFPAGMNALPYSLDDLLNWVTLEQSVVPVAQMPDANQFVVPQPAPITPPPPIAQPQATETAIEAPWRLFLSPNYSGAWAHSPSAVTLGSRTELWHTRLAVRRQQTDGTFQADETIPRRVRAVWSPDYTSGSVPGHPQPPFNSGSDKAPFRMSLDLDDRDQIVRLSSDYTLSLAAAKPEPYIPVSIAADKLYLTSLGAWVDVFGDWPDPLPFGGNAVFSVEQWQHRAAMGRDNYVRVVYAGYLLPFGNAASIVKVTERKLQAINNGPATAYLRQRFFIIVREPLKTFDSLTDAQQRNLPFRSIEITTLVTPDVSPAVDSTLHYAFFPINGPNTFLFHIIGTDWEGQTSEFTAPLFFVERGGDYAQAVTTYNGSATGTRDLAGQKIAFAPSNKLGDTTFHASALTFSAQPSVPVLPDSAPFYPQMDGADIVVPSIQQISGGSGALSVVYFATYISKGMDPGFNSGEVLFQKAGSPIVPLGVGFNGKQSGGVATPNLTVCGLSRKFGTVSGGKPDNVAQGNFDPKDIFSDVGAALFGVVKISELIDDLKNLTSTAPVLTTDRSVPNQITTTLEFAPTVKADYSTDGGFLTLSFGDPNTALNLKATIVASSQGGGPQVSIHGELNNFTLKLAQVIGITINQIAFDAPAGQKMTVNASMPQNSDDGPIQFEGDLSFLNTLQKFIPSDGFQDPPSLDITADGITAGYTLPIPSIGVGIFSIENISLSAQLTLPFFTPNPIRFRFAFSEREHPFLISVSLLRGGAFFGITVGPDGVEILEASLEFGANVSIDVVVASGNVHIMAGVYLKFDMVSNSSQLTGYLRAGGSLEVLGLISASIEFYLGFTYYFGKPCKIAGEATVTIEVHVLMFSASVSASLRREFGDPVVSFADLIGPGDWNDYCDAFAA